MPYDIQSRIRPEMRYQDDMDVMFDTLHGLTDQQCRSIKSRYQFLMREYRRRCFLYSILFYCLRITMSVGSIAVPALMSLNVGPDGEVILKWITWGVSVSVTIAHGITTLFKLDKRFFMLHSVAEKLRTETWQYLQLTGRYSGHWGGHRPTHANQYTLYTSQIEKIRMKHIEEEFVRGADMISDDMRRVGDGIHTNGISGAVLMKGGPTQNGLNMSVPSPADQSKFMTPTPRPPAPPPSLHDSENTSISLPTDAASVPKQSVIDISGN